MPDLKHPNVHPAWSPWTEGLTLHVGAVYFNPLRYQNRRIAAHNFIQRMRTTPNAKLYLVEIAFGDRPYEVSTSSDIQLRTTDILWLKEAGCNVAVSRFEDGWKYGACVDIDFNFTRNDWAVETIHQLQHYEWVQPYSSYAFMTANHQPSRVRPSFTYAFHNYHAGDPSRHMAVKNGKSEGIKGGYPYAKPVELIGSPGGAWAFTNKSFDAVGGMLDICILGAGDWYMAFGFIGYNSLSTQSELRNQPGPYTSAIYAWQRRAAAAIKANIGYIDCFATHEWHGDISNRGYGTRWQILQKYEFDPAKDIRRNAQGLWQWTGNKPRLRDAVNRYFLSRSEDSTEFHGKTLIQP